MKRSRPRGDSSVAAAVAPPSITSVDAPATVESSKPFALSSFAAAVQQSKNSKRHDADATSENLLTPHTLRLLKLIRQGTLEHAQQASAHLTTMMKTASPLQLWDVLGRLQGFLTAADWKTRQQAATALQGVARHLPVSDQVHFLESQHDRDTDTTIKTTATSRSLYLQVNDMVETMPAVLKEGRLLLAVSDATYDRDEEEALQQLDQDAAADDDFVEQRIQLQRQILAQRLGLAGIGRVVGGQGLLPDAITSEDLVSDSPRAKRQRHAERIRKRMQQEKNEGDAEHSVRALLVMKMQDGRNNSEAAGAASHRSPQTLLATELIYRMFDASWYVRHGALLGTLSLLRAWRRHASSNHFGVWPQDILARCLCVLALDRFGDFSGALAPTDMASNTQATGGVVAPVRETAGQLVSVLFAMAPRDLQKTTLELLFSLARYPAEWEVRHGALVAIKFVTVIMTTDQSKPATDWNRTIVEDIARTAIERLTDDSDDVKSVAAQILSEFVRASSDLPKCAWEALRPLWVVLQKIKSVSSCIIDLVLLFSLFLGRDCDASLRALNCFAGDGFSQTGECILQKLAELLDSDFGSVQNSVLKSIAIVIVPLSRLADQKSSGGIVATFCTVTKRVFDLFFVESSFATAPPDDLRLDQCRSVLRDTTWKYIADAAAHCLSVVPADVSRNELELDLICRYFGIKQKRASTDLFGYTSGIAARALAQFLGALSGPEGENSLVGLALSSYLESPWPSQCKAACILFRAIALRRPQEKVYLDFWSRLMGAFQDRPVCLGLEDGPHRHEVLKRDSIAQLCDQAFLEVLSGVRNGDSSVAASAETVVDIWKQTMHLQGLTLTSRESMVATLSSMRVDAALSGAVLAGGLPSKITPIVRALVTSIKNEASVSRQNEVSEYVAELLLLIEHDPVSKFAKARVKILSTMCTMVADNSGHVVSTTGCRGAIRVLQSVVASMPNDSTVKDVAPLWGYLAHLCSAELTFVDKHAPERAASLLRAISGGLSAGKPLTLHVIDTSIANLVFLACRSESADIQALYFATIHSLRAVNAERVLSCAVTALVDYLDDRDHDLYRLAACRLLQSLLEDSGMEICPFVRSLLPLVMSLMTDPVQECSQIANSAFASLVRVAPLVREGSSVVIDRVGVDNHSEAVVDHLILGKPLPPSPLPNPVEVALRESGVVLRQYQVEGVAWLRFLQRVKLNGALCDSMGLGKTLQALIGLAVAHHDALGSGQDREVASLIVCPSSVAGHWVSEIEKFFPCQSIFRPLYFAGSSSDRKAKWKSGMADCNIVVTSYSVLRSDIDLLAKRKWLFMCLDEGHLLKNPNTATSRASRRIRARHKLILTGTPVQNQVNELWAAFDFLMPNFLGSSASFANEYARPISKSLLPGASADSVSAGIDKLKVLHQQVLPFILRREKEHVLRELPPKTVTVIKVSMSDLQSKIYTDFCSGDEARRSLSALQNAINNAQSTDGTETEKDGMTIGADALKSLLFLRLLCTHPFLVLSGPESSRAVGAEYYERDASGKLVALTELLGQAGIYRDELVGADNDSSLLYCDENGSDETDAESSLLEVDETSAPLFNSPESDVGEGSKCLIFAQFTRSLDVVEEFLFKPHMPSLRYLRLDGRVPARKRTELVESFNRDPSIKVMLLTTRAGGLGLNLIGE